MIDRTKRIWIGASVAVIALVIVLVLVLGQKDQAAEDGSLEGKGPVVELVFQDGELRALPVSDFNQLLADSELPVFVDFWAAWCGPCRTAAPFIDTLPQTFAGQARVVKVDVDNAQVIARDYGVQSIPLFVLFDQGDVADYAVGYGDGSEGILTEMITNRVQP